MKTQPPNDVEAGQASLGAFPHRSGSRHFSVMASKTHVRASRRLAGLAFTTLLLQAGVVHLLAMPACLDHATYGHPSAGEVSAESHPEVGDHAARRDHHGGHPTGAEDGETDGSCACENLCMSMVGPALALSVSVGEAVERAPQFVSPAPHPPVCADVQVPAHLIPYPMPPPNAL